MKRVGLTIWLLLLAVSTNLYDVEGRSTGPPADEPLNFDLVCNQMTPNSFNHGSPMGGNGGYFIDISPSMSEVAGGFTYVGGQIYTIRVVGTGGSTFRGFLVQARAPNNPPPAAPMLLGSFQTGAGNQRTLDCDAVGASATAAIGHSINLGGVGSVEFSWVAPSTGGTVDFHYTVVRTRTTHFDAMSAKAEGLFTMPPTTQAPTTLAPGNPIVPQRSPEDYRLIFSNPEGCIISDCDHFIGIDTNAGDSNYLDIYMEGDAAGWVAVGFSETSDMFLADVVACNRVGDTITALDNWNINGRDSLTDTLQDVTLFNSSFVDGRIKCTVAKRIAPSDTFDLDLNRNLYVIYARRIATSVSGLTRLNSHSAGGITVRSMSAEQVNPAQTGGTVGGSEFYRVTRPWVLLCLLLSLHLFY